MSVNLWTIKSLNLKINFVRKTVMLHKHKTAHWKHTFCSHVFVAERHSDSYSIILCLPVFRKKKLDIQTIFQLFRCLSATNIYLHLPLTFLWWTISDQLASIHRWRSIDHVTMSLRDIMDYKQTSWLVNVTFDWHKFVMMAVQLYDRTHNISTPRILHNQHRIFTINTQK